MPLRHVLLLRWTEDWATYRDHPARLGLIRRHIRPILASRVAVQF